MSQYPQPPAGNYPPAPGVYPDAQPPRTSGAAITALIMGLLLCIPFITGLGGIIFGAIGLGATKNPRVTGKGMAITGIVLGLVNIIFWALFGGGVWALVSGTKEQREIAKSFIEDMSAGNINGAAAKCHSTMARDNLVQSSTAMQAWGKVKDITTFGIKAGTDTTSGSQVVVSGMATFDKVQKQFTIILAKEGNDWKIIQYQFPN